MSLDKALGDIKNAFDRFRLVDSTDIKVVRGCNGTQAYLVNPIAASTGGSSGTTVHPSKMKSGTTLAGYIADFYDNGFDQAVTQSNQPCQVLDLAASDNVPSGEQFMAIPMSTTVTGDTE